MRRLLFIVALGLSGAQAQADQITYFGLTHESLIGKSSFDGFWNNGNDLDVSIFGLNPTGSASSFLNSDGAFGFYSSLERLVDSNANGTYTDLAASGTSELSASNLSFTNIPFTFALSATGANSGTFNSLTQTIEGNYDLLAEGPFGQTFIVRTHSVGVFVVNGQNPADVITDLTLLNHVNFLIPLLPANWQIMYTSAEDYTILDPLTQISSGTTGNASLVAYSVVPVPAALPLFLTAVGGAFGLSRVSRRKDRNRI